ncbi:hypothetical protein DFH05DRAFT_1489833 [Lentinula detonsa]|uniref:Uncharacterized protein n=1 Tax=Lentinula detonsa TaxID=2804962 RepID=A0A9W8P2V9_9AGAR|nr:hypothetical protein DFH05DRAFT_1489833 [Lentinula detonsa]
MWTMAGILLVEWYQAHILLASLRFSERHSLMFEENLLEPVFQNSQLNNVSAEMPYRKSPSPHVILGLCFSSTPAISHIA